MKPHPGTRRLLNIIDNIKNIETFKVGDDLKRSVEDLATIEDIHRALKEKRWTKNTLLRFPNISNKSIGMMLLEAGLSNDHLDKGGASSMKELEERIIKLEQRFEAGF